MRHFVQRAGYLIALACAPLVATAAPGPGVVSLSPSSQSQTNATPLFVFDSLRCVMTIAHDDDE